MTDDRTELTPEQFTALLQAYDAMLALYRQTFPPGTVSPDGRYRMGDDGKWWGRCAVGYRYQPQRDDSGPWDQSLAESYINRAKPGTYDVEDGAK